MFSTSSAKTLSKVILIFFFFFRTNCFCFFQLKWSLRSGASLFLKNIIVQCLSDPKYVLFSSLRIKISDKVCEPLV